MRSRAKRSSAAQVSSSNCTRLPGIRSVSFWRKSLVEIDPLLSPARPHLRGNERKPTQLERNLLSVQVSLKYGTNASGAAAMLRFQNMLDPDRQLANANAGRVIDRVRH